jgi:hypothetical protein
MDPHGGASMRPSRIRIIWLTVLAIVIAIGLTYAAIALPRAVASAMNGAFELPGFDTTVDPYGTETVARVPVVQRIGFGSFLVVLVLIAAGLVTERRGLAGVGAVAFFLPIVGHFAAGMLFLAGLAVLRVAWLPLLYVSHDILRLGDIGFVPYAAVVYLLALIGIDGREAFVWLLMGIGMLLFVLGTVGWLYARSQKKGTADFWVYRLGRHPQYLGWITWSYGFMIYSMLHSQLGATRVNYGMPSSLPWLVSALVILGIAMLEELRMRRVRGEEYEAYVRRTPFMLPLPRVLRRGIACPLQLVLRKEHPESGTDVAVVVGAYLVILMLLSVPFVVLDWPPGGHLAGSHTGWWSFPFNVPPFR